jgi:hypothetical protein
MPKQYEMLSSILTTWIMTAVICAALPFLRAAQSVQTALDGFLPLLIALAIGIVAGVALTSLTRRLCGLEGSWRFDWERMTAGSAALAGIIVWGLPLGLVFAVDDFLSAASWSALIDLLIWPAMGAVFGPAMRWLTPGNRPA